MTNFQHMENATLCCSQFYEQDWVRRLLGDSFHPGGLSLTVRLLDSLGLPSGARVLDLACGTGSTALKMVTEYGWKVTGLDFSQINLEVAARRAEKQGLGIVFARGDSSRLPFETDHFDAVVCECSLSIFHDKSAVLSEIARVLHVDGQLGMSDMALQAPLSQELAVAAAPWTCLAQALSVEDNQCLLLKHGFRIFECHDETGALCEMVTDLKRRILVAGLTALSSQTTPAFDIRQIRALLQQAALTVRSGQVEYFRIRSGLGRPPSPARPACRPARECGC